MSILRTVTIAFSLSAIAVPVFAADMNGPIIAPPPVFNPGSTPVEFGSGWYLRGDVGYTFDAEYSQGFGYSTAIGDFLRYDYADTVSFRGGFGYRVNSNIRLDVTLESVMDSEFENTIGRSFGGTRTVDVPDGLGGTNPDVVYFNSAGTVLGTDNSLYTGTTIVPITGTEVIEASYGAETLMFSGYLDMPKMGKITPYIGAGGGIARMTYNETRVRTCEPSATETCNAGDVLGVLIENVEWKPAYSLTAGTAVELNDKLSLDVGYTYQRIGHGDKLNYANGAGIDVNGFTTHSVKAGLRYEIW